MANKAGILKNKYLRKFYSAKQIINAKEASEKLYKENIIKVIESMWKSSNKDSKAKIQIIVKKLIFFENVMNILSRHKVKSEFSFDRFLQLSGEIGLFDLQNVDKNQQIKFVNVSEIGNYHRNIGMAPKAALKILFFSTATILSFFALASSVPFTGGASAVSGIGCLIFNYKELINNASLINCGDRLLSHTNTYNRNIKGLLEAISEYNEGDDITKNNFYLSVPSSKEILAKKELTYGVIQDMMANIK